MGLNSLLLSSDEKTVRVLRRVLSDLEIGVELCSGADAAIRKLTRQRFEAIIVDCSNREEAHNVLKSIKAAPVNKRALSIALVEAAVGLRGGFEMGAHFVLYKPLSNERTKASFRAVRAMMNRERRLQLRVPIQVPVTCNGSDKYKARTIDLCEGGMAIDFMGNLAKENSLRFSLELPGIARKLELYGELAWEDNENQAGVRFTNLREDHRETLRQWLNCRIPEAEQDDPPIACTLTDLSQGGCYLKTSSPFPKGTRVVLSMKNSEVETRAGGIVRVAHPEFGMGVEFVQATSEQRAHTLRIIEALRSTLDQAPELQVAPDGLETSAATEATPQGTSDALVDLFVHKSQVPVELFLQHMEQQRQTLESR
ncbi:MAG TPA: PilZ domain-containing protein [Terriglobales bacterium]|nr:PilZ domain-containing protein [Terriglobales bacterium]